MQEAPIVYDLYCGLGGWSAGFLDAGYRCVGYDIEAHDYGSGGYPGELVLRDVRSIHGSEFKDATCIVASPPCQEPSVRAMPWKSSRALRPSEVGISAPVWWSIPEKPSNTMRGMTAKELREWRLWQEKYPKPAPELFIELFNSCFRIQREACEAASRYIPMVVENVRGAQKWVGRAKANYGSYFLWGDVGMVGNRVVAMVEGRLLGHGVAPVKASKIPGSRFDGSGGSFQSAAVKVAGEKGRRTDVGNGARFTSRDCGVERMYLPSDVRLPESGYKPGAGEQSLPDPQLEPVSLPRLSGSQSGLKVPGIKLSDVGFNVAAAQRYREDQRESDEVKQPGIGGMRENGKGDAWFQDGAAKHGSKSNSRKAASALIAKIPYALSAYLAQSFKL